MIRPTKKASDLKAGEKLPILEKSFTSVDLVAYGAATWDWHRLHYDQDYARAKKLPGVIVDGQAFGALLARAALDWAGPRAFLARMSLRMKSMAFAGDTLRAEGEVSAIQKGRISLVQKLMNGDRVAAEATTEIRLPE